MKLSGLKHLKRVWRALPLTDYVRWRATSMMLEPLLPFIKGSVVYNAYLLEKEWHSKNIRPFHGDPLPTLPFQQKEDIFFWGVIDWRFRIQRPQHLALGFAGKGHRVFYISPSFVNDKRSGFELQQIDETGHVCVYNVRLHLKSRPRIYAAPSSQEDAIRLQESVASLLAWIRSRRSVSIIQHPYWYELAGKLPNNRLIYDCMDHHEGFDNTGHGIAPLELTLLKQADAVVATSQSLKDFASKHNPHVALIRNAADYEFFARQPDSVFRDGAGRRVIGYYGAISHWIDVDLLAEVAKSFPDCLLLLVGADDCEARHRLGALANVQFTGEVNYNVLPYYLYGMDVCLLPFRVIPLTLATNPVKVYEYLSAGKPVVAIRLPELAQFEGLVATAEDHAKFIRMVGESLSGKEDSSVPSARQTFAAKNTWSHRVDALEKVLEEADEPRVSIIVVTYNNIDLSRICLNSIAQYTDYENLEVIVVDNASSDATPSFLRTWEEAGPHRKVLLNSDNRGFAAANNQGLDLASGDYLVLLNNDTEVTPGWLRTLMRHLKQDSSVGMVGPVTNNIGNEARIKIQYKNSEEMRRKALDYTLHHMGKSFPIRTLAFFCVMFPRHVYKRVGLLDEVYGLGFFEDDDYCRRVEMAGLRLVCAEDVFIHHHSSAAFNKLGKNRQVLLDKNRKIYEAKWGQWVPHQDR
jgi:GT2 family glycosyltransferase